MIRRRKASHTLLLVLLASMPRLTAAETQVELNGWRLQQLIQAVEATMGKPVEVVDQDHLHYKAYMIDDRAYMVFGVDDRIPNYLHSVQLTGTTTKALPFRGLMLGDSESQVRAVLGDPTETVEIASPKVTRFEYDQHNYSIELDEHRRLFSIRLHTGNDVVANLPDGDPWPAFKAAILAQDFAALAELLRPDVEVFTPTDTLSIRGSYRDFVTAPDAGFTAALFAEDNSVRAELALSEPEQQLRLMENVGVGFVYKFPKGRILREIVFLPYAGSYRVYEIAFRGAEEAPQPSPVPASITLGAR